MVSDDNADDDIPLDHLAGIIGISVSMDDNVNIDAKLQATEPMSDCVILADILSDLSEARSADTVSSDEEAALDESVMRDKPKPTTQQASDACETIRAFIETVDGAEDIMAKFDDVERLIVEIKR